MRILLVNKYLYRKGGAETYVIKLGEYLQSAGHEVQYFGMADSRNVVGNECGAYSGNMDFHSSSFKKLIYPLSIIYSFGAAKQMSKVLKSFKPDVVHLNNFNYQLTPSIIYAAKKHNIPLVYTAHDSQLVCPSHRMKSEACEGLCRECFGGGYKSCVKHKCIHSSTLRSAIGAFEAWLYRKKHTYRLIDKIICPSQFIEREISNNPDISGRTAVMYNFIEEIIPSGVERDNYVLYFGRYGEEKGIRTLIKAAKALPKVQFVFAGRGELENEINSVANIRNVGFKTGEELNAIIEKAAFTVLPSEWSENCPFTVMESQTLRTPVIGANIGGIGELIEEGRTGMLFESGNARELTEKIAYLHENKELCLAMGERCKSLSYDTVSDYAKKLISIYKDLVK